MHQKKKEMGAFKIIYTLGVVSSENAQPCAHELSLKCISAGLIQY